MKYPGSSQGGAPSAEPEEPRRPDPGHDVEVAVAREAVRGGRLLPPRADLSQTKLVSWRRCPQRHFFHYVMRWRDDDEETEAADVGSAVHAVLEAAGVARIRRLVDTPVASVKELRRYLKIMEAEGAVDPDMAALAHVKLQAIGPVDFAGATRVEMGWQVDLGRATDPRSGAERTVTLGGAFDRVDEDPADRHVELYDWKTGMPKSREELLAEPQTGLYLHAARVLWPGWTCGITYVYLGDRVRVRIQHDDDLVDGAVYLALRMWEAMQEGYYPPRPGRQCATCPFLWACPSGTDHVPRTEWAAMFAMADVLGIELEKAESAFGCDGGPPVPVAHLEDMASRWSPDQLCEVFLALNDVEKEAKSLRQILATRIKERLGAWVVAGRLGRHQVKIRRKALRDYTPRDVVAVAKVMGRDPEALLMDSKGGNRGVIDQMVAGHPEAQRVLRSRQRWDYAEWLEVKPLHDMEGD